jgi:hypothetical protein
MIGTIASKALHSPQYIYLYFASLGSAAFSGTKHGRSIVDSQYGQIGGFFLQVSDLLSNGIIYLLGYLSAFFLGLPLPGTLRIASRADLSYIPVGPAYDIGLMFFLISCIFTAPVSLSNSLAISAIVMPSIFLLSANKVRIVTDIQHLLNVYKVKLNKKAKKCCESAIYNLTYCCESATIKT